MALTLSNINIINYKSILNTSIDVKKIDGSYTTILVGLNEMGKSNFLNAIELIDYPVKDVNFNSLKNTSNEKGKYIEAYFEYTFSSENEWRDILSSKIKAPKSFLDKLFIKNICKNVYLEKGKTRFETNFSVNYNEIEQEFIEGYSYEKISSQVETGDTYVYEIIANTSIPETSVGAQSVETKQYIPLTEDALNGILDKIFATQFADCKQKFSKWEYKSEYLITKTIDLNTFKADAKTCYPLKNVFALIGCKTQKQIEEQINDVASNKNAIQRLEKKLKNAMTDYVQKVWDECSLEFDVKIQDNMQLDVFVQDKADPDNYFGMVDRSDGAKHFLSLILSISVANETDILKNNIIVIDEPEVHMHPSGIRYIREELLKIGRNNYVFIATHSQFMIDNKNKERHYIVTKPHNNTEVHQWDETKDLSDDEILRAAFGINVLNDFLSPYKLLVEGYSDCQILKKALNILKQHNCIGITNGMGSKIVSTAGMLKFYNVPVLTILDADNEGCGYKSKIIELGEPYSDDNVKTIKDMVDSIISKGTIEDTLKPEYVSKHCKDATKEITGFSSWNFSYTGTKPILDELKIYIQQINAEYDVKVIMELTKTKIGENFSPTKASLTNDTPKLKDLCQKILEKLGLGA